MIAGSIHYFAEMDLEALKELNFLQKILGAITKLSPILIKLFHILKFGLILGLAYFALIAKASMFVKTGKYVSYNDTAWYTALNITTNCQNATWANITLTDYNRTIVYFYGFDFFILLICFFLLGLIKNIVDHPAFVYVPMATDTSSFMRFCCQYLGP